MLRPRAFVLFGTVRVEVKRTLQICDAQNESATNRTLDKAPRDWCLAVSDEEEEELSEGSWRFLATFPFL